MKCNECNAVLSIASAAGRNLAIFSLKIYKDVNCTRLVLIKSKVNHTFSISPFSTNRLSILSFDSFCFLIHSFSFLSSGFESPSILKSKLWTDLVNHYQYIIIKGINHHFVFYTLFSSTTNKTRPSSDSEAPTVNEQTIQSVDKTTMP